MAANDSESHLPYWNKLADQYNNTYHPSSIKILLILIILLWLKKIGTNPKAPKFKFNEIVRITKNKNIISKGYTESWSREKFIINSVLKTNPWKYKTKDLKEKNNRRFLWKRSVSE